MHCAFKALWASLQVSGGKGLEGLPDARRKERRAYGEHKRNEAWGIFG